jgi:hypothetical protein
VRRDEQTEGVGRLCVLKAASGLRVCTDRVEVPQCYRAQLARVGAVMEICSTMAFVRA